MAHQQSRSRSSLGAALAAALLATAAAAQSTFTPAELSRAGHVLRRMQHGASVFDYPSVLPDPVNSQLTNIFNYIVAKSGPTPLNAGAEANNLLALYPFPVTVGLGDPANPGHIPQTASVGFRVHELAETAIIRAVWSEDTLREVMTRFWQEHFNTNWGVIYVRLRDRFQNEGYANFDILAQEYATYFEWQQNDLFRLNALGNFRTLLGVSAKNLPMMIYLDTVDSAGPKPNENYARELYELHTMSPRSPFPSPFGAVQLPNYTYDDIVTGAAAFSGWTLVNQSTAPTPPNLSLVFLGTSCPGQAPHVATCPSPGVKTLFNASFLNPLVGALTIPENHTAPTEGDLLLDHLANSYVTAYFVSKKLYKLFISDVEPDPFDPLLLQCLSAWATQPGGNIQAVVQTLVSSNEFLNDTTLRWTNERQPIEAVAQTVDVFHGIGFNPTVGTTPAQQKARIARLRTLIEEHGGQYLFRYGPPDGFTRGDSELLTTYRMLGATKLRQELYSLFGPFTSNYPSVFFDYLNVLTPVINWVDENSILNWFNLIAFNNELSGGDASLIFWFLFTDLNGNVGNTLLTDAVNNLPVFIQRVTTGLAFIACHPLNNLK